MSELGRIRPPYGGVTRCAAQECESPELGEELGAYLFRDLETDKMLVFCGSCAAYVELHRQDRFLLIAL